ncbi:MAG: tetratricopeptide repeat protein [Acidobacteriota bacterium]|nr:tetratricopeptide repeat protein [Acidobacteriota bacterium]
MTKSSTSSTPFQRNRWPRAALVLVAAAAVAVLLVQARGAESTPAAQPAPPAPKRESPPATQPAPKRELPFKYDYRFGENPFLPGQAQTSDGGFIAAERFPKAQWCAKCHQDVHQQWRESAHANAFRAPFYLKNVQLLIDSKGIEFTRHCESCHNPIALFSGALTKGAKVNRRFDEDGVTCMVCHSIQKIQNTGGIGSYVMGVPAVMVKEDGTPVTGKVDYDDILLHPELHKRAMMRDFYRSPEFCAVCHKAAVPRQLNDYKWLRAFTVYDEWQQSSWSRQSPLPFYKKDAVSTCQTCHMLPGAVADFASPAGKAASHRFLGANTAIPFFYNYPDQMREITKFLQDGILGIDLFALEKNSPEALRVAPLGGQTFTLAGGDEVTLSLVIQNKKIGHAYVPEQRDFYESWVEFQVTDAAGRSVYSSGLLKPDGFLDERAHSYTNRLLSKDGKLLDRHQVWETRTRAYDNTILPGRSNLVRYQFRIPPDAKGPLTVTAKVRYRRFRRGYTDFILGKSVDYPVVDIAARSMTLNLGENLPASAGTPQEQLLRWNNYGISLLDQQQYAAAAEAFSHVLQLQPEYVDGWINLALANFSYEKYQPASKALDRALALAPGTPRALFYVAMIDRVYGRLDAATEKFLAVIQAYPRLRQARQELGFTYYQRKQYTLAREQYEALQQIDPDDLSAHYNLMLIYRRLGLKEKAAQQATYFADRKDDPTANAVAQDYLRAHTEFSIESVPWHVHVASDVTPEPRLGEQKLGGQKTGAQKTAGQKPGGPKKR